MAKLLRNALQTPDGTIIESTSRHDYVTYKDANGRIYLVDGGLDYCRRSNHGDEKLMYVYDDIPHEEARELVTWGTYGKNGDEPLTYKKVADMEDGHLMAVITKCAAYPQVKEVMAEELRQRGHDFQYTEETEKSITVEAFESLADFLKDFEERKEKISKEFDKMLDNDEDV